MSRRRRTSSTQQASADPTGLIVVVLIIAALWWWKNQGGIPLVNPPAVAKVTWVRESRDTETPDAIKVAFRNLNRDGSSIVAADIDVDIVDGATGQTPPEHAVALEVAAEAGHPCLVVEYDDGSVAVGSSYQDLVKVLGFEP